jgi:YebC/PmpR family DNA-binding regulatory protein
MRMSGHSRWSTIKRKKAANDAKKSKVWTKLLKEIQVAAKVGGGDLSGNPRLRLAIDRGRSANLTKDAIARAIDKGSGGSSTESYEDIMYEGYGPGGVAVVVECTTDNRNRTVGEVRHAFDKVGGHLGNSGSVAWLFKKRGVINVLKSSVSEDRIMEIALEYGADDVRDDQEVWTIDTDPVAFLGAKEALESAGIAVEHAEVDNVPETRVKVGEDKAQTVLRLIGLLEELDDVQNVYANFDIDDDVLERLG